jgi:uncharacterized protein (TIGR03083 family)
MDTSDYLESITRDIAAFRVAVSRADLRAPVPGCPGWTVADLLWHVAEVYQFWGFIVANRAEDPAAYAEPERPADDGLLAFFDENVAQVMQALTTTPSDTAVWTWSTDHSVGFVQRRMAHETAVHRWDAERAAGDVPEMDASLASDGIDEFLHHVYGSRWATEEPVGGSVHIHCGDVPGEWTIRPTADGFDVTREHAKGDCALRGGAANLLLTLWRRLGLDTVDVVGDADVARRFIGATRLD